MAVQSARRFICQNQFGLIDDCPGTSTSLLLTARHLIGIFVKNIRDVQLSGYFSYPTINLTCGNSIDCQCQSNILANGQSVQQVKVLKHKSKVLPAKPGMPSSGMQHGFPDNLISLILPTLTLGCGYAALIARTTRSSVLEVVRQDYIDMARAKGLTENAVIWKHMLKNALIPIVTVVGLNFGTLLGGSVLTESIFSWPGVGRFVVDSISYKDTPAVLGSVVTLAILFTIVNLIVDLLYAFLDPRIKSEYQSSWKRAKKK